MRVWIIVAAIVFSACSGPSRASSKHTAKKTRTFRVERASPIPGDARLPTTFVPTAYQARIALHEATFDATITIRANLTTPNDTILLDAHGLVVKRARARRGGGEWVPLEARMVRNDALVTQKLALLAATPMPAGNVTLEIEYRGPIDNLGVVDELRGARRASVVLGAVRQTFEGKDYVFSMFEPFSARKVFPCVDEPSNRATWTLTLDVPAADIAASNTPIVRETALDATTKRVEFAPTLPLPSYLVAFAVGPFDVVETKSSAHGTPIRLLAQHGRGTAAKHAADQLAPILDALDTWTQIPYPFGKIDVVSVPMSGSGWFAMEHPGLVTIAEMGVRLGMPGADRDWIETMTHELAHQWFGNLVTHTWWNDIWLTESFTKWLTDKIVRQLRPLDDTMDRVRYDLQVLESDQNRWHAIAPTIRAPLGHSFTFEQIGPYFSGDRGAVYLASLEAFVGPDAFRALIRSYLSEHRLRSVSSSAFAEALRPTGADAGFEHVLDSPGLPRLSIELACTPAKNVARISVTADWNVPACIAFGTTTRTDRCLVVGDGTEVDLGATCPTWISPNATGAGFYRTVWTSALLEGLVRYAGAHLGARERARLLVELESATTLHTSAQLAAAIDLYKAGANDPMARMWIASTLAAQYPKLPDDLRPALAKTLEPLVARVRGYDFSTTAGSADEQSARAAELELAATIGDPALVARGPALYASLSKTAMVYWPWIRLLAARGNPALIPELLASSVHDNESTLARYPNIARVIATMSLAPSKTLRLLHRACSDNERADALAAAKLANTDDLVRPIDACIAERAKVEPVFRAWLRGTRGARRLR